MQHVKNNEKMEMVPGMTFTIEPIFVEGHHASINWDNGWTVCTVDGGLAAQFQHTVLITEGGAEIITSFGSE